MCPTTRFHEDEGRRLAGDQCQQLAPRHSRVRFDRALRGHNADLKHVFSEVNTNNRRSIYSSLCASTLAEKLSISSVLRRQSRENRRVSLPCTRIHIYQRQPTTNCYKLSDTSSAITISPGLQHYLYTRLSALVSAFSGIVDVRKPQVWLAKKPKQVQMFLCQIEHHGPLACLTEQVNAHKILQHPTSRRIGNPFPFLVGKGGCLVFEGLADAIVSGGVYEQTHRHHHQQGHDTFGLCEVERRG